MDDLTKTALVWVNRQRESLQLDRLERLVPGKTGDSSSCPIASSVVVGSRYTANVFEFLFVYNVRFMGYDAYRVINGITTPIAVRQWIAQFDMGKYPEYIKESSYAS